MIVAVLILDLPNADKATRRANKGASKGASKRSPGSKTGSARRSERREASKSGGPKDGELARKLERVGSRSRTTSIDQSGRLESERERSKTTRNGYK